MEFIAKYLYPMPVIKGKSANGEWIKQDLIFESDAQYPKKICVSNWTNKIDVSTLQTNLFYKVFVNVESKEFNNKWFTELRVWKIESKTDVTTTKEESTTPSINPTNFLDLNKLDDDDVLPF